MVDKQAIVCPSCEGQIYEWWIERCDQCGMTFSPNFLAILAQRAEELRIESVQAAQARNLPTARPKLSDTGVEGRPLNAQSGIQFTSDLQSIPLAKVVIDDPADPTRGSGDALAKANTQPELAQSMDAGGRKPGEGKPGEGKPGEGKPGNLFSPGNLLSSIDQRQQVAGSLVSRVAVRSAVVLAVWALLFSVLGAWAYFPATVATLLALVGLGSGEKKVAVLALGISFVSFFAIWLQAS